METLYRYVSGAMTGIAALFAPAGPLAATTLLFIAADFLTGVAADRAITRRRGDRWCFESRKAWRTLHKALLAVALILLAWLLDACVLANAQPHASRLIAGFACGVEFWSLLENAAHISEAPLFRYLRRYVRRRIGEEAGDE